MPRLLPIENPNNLLALLALRRTLWQLAILGIASAIAIGILAKTPGVLPTWLLLAPIAALLVHHRETLLALVRAAAHIDRRAANPRRPPLRRQANQRGELMSRPRLSRPTLPVQQAR